MGTKTNSRGMTIAAIVRGITDGEIRSIDAHFTNHPSFFGLPNPWDLDEDANVDDLDGITYVDGAGRNLSDEDYECEHLYRTDGGQHFIVGESSWAWSHPHNRGFSDGWYVRTLTNREAKEWVERH